MGAVVMAAAKAPSGLSLEQVASKLKFEVTDLDEGIYGLDSKVCVGWWWLGWVGLVLCGMGGGVVPSVIDGWVDGCLLPACRFLLLRMHHALPT
jgi:hypothetical protein